MQRFRFENRIRVAIIALGAAVLLFPSSGKAQSADYEFFKTRVQPIFLKNRDTHGRCVTCHGNGNGGGFVLQPLPPGGTWTEEQTMRNFAAASNLVQPGKPTSSQLLMHPLAPAAGGDLFHSGGHQFASQDDPDWRELAAWVLQKPAAQYKNLRVLQSGDHLIEVMRFFNISLRVDCSHCHVANDYSSDARPTKATARQMMQLTEDLNTKLGAGNISCYTCHRGDEKPRTLHPDFPNLKFPN